MTTLHEPAVGPLRWAAAAVIGLVVWAAVSTFATGVTTPIFGTAPVGLVGGAILGVLVAGWIVGARSAKRWIMVGVLTLGLIAAASAVIVIGFLNAFT